MNSAKVIRSCVTIGMIAGLSAGAPIPIRAATSAPASSSTAELDVREDATVQAVRKVLPSVVNIATEEVVPVRDPLENLFREFFDPYHRRRPPNTQFSLGSGVIIDEDGYVLTNFHVVGRAKRVWVRLADGRELECDRISGDRVSDIALVKIRSKIEGEKFTAVKLAADDDLLLGETVLAMGNPFGLGGSVSRGILSSKARRPPISDNEPLDVPDWLQTDASINPGNSGGALVNLRGELIGINVAIYSQGQGIGFAIPVKLLAQKLAEIYSPELLKQLWFGARVRPGDQPLQILSVQNESPAGQAGLRPADRILAVDGQKPRSFIQLTELLQAAGDKREVRLTIERGRETRSVSVRLRPEKEFFNAELIQKKIGASVQELTPELARGLGVRPGDGLLVAGVDRGGPAALAELRRGMVITALDGIEIEDLTTAAKMLYGKSRGDKVKVSLVVTVQRGAFVQQSQALTEVTIK